MQILFCNTVKYPVVQILFFCNTIKYPVVQIFLCRQKQKPRTRYKCHTKNTNTTMKNNNSPAPAQMFVQINLQKSKQGQIEIGKHIRQMNKKQLPFICLVQEPMMYKNKLSMQPQSCKKYNHSSKPRTVIYTDMSTQAWYIESLSTGDITVIQTKIKNRSTMVISCYLDINIKEVIPKELNKALDYAQNHGLAVILGMDSNAHSTSFGTSTNKRLSLIHI